MGHASCLAFALSFSHSNTLNQLWALVYLEGVSVYVCVHFDESLIFPSGICSSPFGFTHTQTHIDAAHTPACLKSYFNVRAYCVLLLKNTSVSVKNPLCCFKSYITLLLSVYTEPLKAAKRGEWIVCTKPAIMELLWWNQPHHLPAVYYSEMF